MLADNEVIANAKHVFQPQEGKQTDFLSTKADICLYGGAAGGGKTYAILLENLRHHLNPRFRGVIFRRQSTDITKAGALWDESQKIYPVFGGISNQQFLRWTFPSGATISFNHCNTENDKYTYKGMQATLITFDELTDFTESQFFYLMSRNRSDAGVAGYIRMTCNPDPDSWVKDLIRWWLDENGKYADETKSGALRYFCRGPDDIIRWASTKNELIEEYGFHFTAIQSFAFIPSKVEDNKILLEHDQTYISKLMNMKNAEGKRLLLGDWSIKPAGDMFKQSDFKIYLQIPHQIDFKIITVDGANKDGERNDFSVLECWALSNKGIYLIDVLRGKWKFNDLKINAISFINKHKPNRTYIEDKQSGTQLGQELQRARFLVEFVQRSKDKYTRAYDCQGWVEGGYIYLNPMAEYYIPFINEVTAFAKDLANTKSEVSKQHDDQVDCMMDAIDKLLINPPPIFENGSVEMDLSSRIC